MIALLLLLAATPAKTWTVREGDTCASISKATWGSDRDYTKLHSFNPDLGPTPHRLKAGQVLRLSAAVEDVPVAPAGPDATLTFIKPAVTARTTVVPEWKPANQGQELFVHDEVNTLKRAAAVITFKDTSRLQLRENALVVIQGTAPNAALRGESGGIELVSGEARVSLASLRGVALPVQTPASRIDVKGQSLLLSVDEGQMSRISAHKGGAVVSAQGATVTVFQGEGTRVAKGLAPEKPRPLPLTPGFSGFPELVLTTPGVVANVDVEWGGVTTKGDYRLEVATDENFDGLIDDQLGASTAATLALPPGRYWVRVSARDVDGLVSVPSDGRRVDVVEFTPPRGGPAPVVLGPLPAVGTVTLDAQPYTPGKLVAELGQHRVRVQHQGASASREFFVELPAVQLQLVKDRVVLKVSRESATVEGGWSLLGANGQAYPLTVSGDTLQSGPVPVGSFTAAWFGAKAATIERAR